MAVRMASDTIRTLYAIQCITKDVKHRSQSPVYKNKSQEMCNIEKIRQMGTKSSTDSITYDPSSSEALHERYKQQSSNENALVHKIHPNDRPLRNDVPERTKCHELDEILAKWNVYQPKK